MQWVGRQHTKLSERTANEIDHGQVLSSRYDAPRTSFAFRCNIPKV